MRPLSYKSTDVFVICFSVVARDTLADVRRKWHAEVRQFATPIVLVATKVDLRTTTDTKHQVITDESLTTIVVPYDV